MRIYKSIRLRIRSLFRRNCVEEELDAEMRDHLERQIQMHVAAGMSPGDARNIALREFGNVALIQEQCRDMRGVNYIEDIFRDIKHALRTLRREPGFTAAAVLILALGIGANATVFSVVNAILFRPLPFDQPERLGWVVPFAQNNPQEGLSASTSRVVIYERLREAESLESMTAFNAFYSFGGYNLIYHGDAERLTGVGVAQNFFDVLGIKLFLGRPFSPEECVKNGRNAVILSYALWQRRFGGNSSIVGRAIQLGEESVDIVGVAPPDFDFASVFAAGTRLDLFVPLRLEEVRDYGNELSLIGRLKSGATFGNAQAEMDVIAVHVTDENIWGLDKGVWIRPLTQYVSGNVRPVLTVLWCAIAMVLLIVCANLSNLLLARASKRGREMATRAALGAPKGRLIRQLLTESLLLSVVGAALGLVLAFGAVRYLAISGAVKIPRIDTATVDGSALGFTLGVAVLAALIFGIVPAMRQSRVNLQQALNTEARGSTMGRAQRWYSSALVVSEIALACILLVCAGLLLRSFHKLLDQDLGFETENSAVIRIDPSVRFDGYEQQVAYFEELLRQVRAMPGIAAAATGDSLPLDRNRTWVVAAKGVQEAPEDYPTAFVHLTSTAYLSTLGIPLLEGREFDDTDRIGAPRVVLVNQSLAKRLWPDRNAIGRTALVGGNEWRVIGVVADVKTTRLDEAAGNEIYFPVSAAPIASLDLVVRGRLPAENLASSVRTTLRHFDPTLPANEFRTLESLVNHAVSPRQFLVVSLWVFAGMALVLASLGIYAVIAYSVVLRTQEIGIRMALGAPAGKVLAGVIWDTWRLAFLGILLGGFGSIAISRLLQSLLYQISPNDPATFASTILTLGAVALTAGLIPALKAARINPIIALRHE
jgi:predicted permease